MGSSILPIFIEVLNIALILSTVKFKCKQTNNVTSWGPEECQHEPWWALIATFGVARQVIFSWMFRNTLPQSPSLPLSHIVTWTP